MSRRLCRSGLGLLAAALICSSLAACSGTSDGGGHHGLMAAHSPRHSSGPRRASKSRARHRQRASRHAARRPGRIVTSSCRYRDPAASACGSVPSADACQAVDGGALEDRSCTPGAIDPRVTQADIHSTICVSGYTDTVRPPVSYTAPLESELIRSYDLSLGPSQTELDHLISLELGGAPADVRNLWPEPYAGGEAPTTRTRSRTDFTPRSAPARSRWPRRRRRSSTSSSTRRQARPRRLRRAARPRARPRRLQAPGRTATRTTRAPAWMRTPPTTTARAAGETGRSTCRARSASSAPTTTTSTATETASAARSGGLAAARY